MKMFPKMLIGVLLAVGAIAMTASLAMAPDVPTFEQTVEKATQATVYVQRDDGGHGSGVIVKAGIVVTARHVVDGATKITLRFPNGVTVDAKVVGVSQTDDVAILSFDTSYYISVPLRYGVVKPGEFIFTIGHPASFTLVATFGYVAGILTQDDMGMPLPGAGFVLSNMSAWFGNSGGGVFDKNGQVVGVLTNLIAPVWPDMRGDRAAILTMFVPAKSACDLLAKLGV
jgi:serine protease Do